MSTEPRITFHLPIAQFRELLEVVLATETPDELSNAVLLACTRPRHGIVWVPLAPGVAAAIAALVAAWAAEEPSFADLSTVLAKEIRTQHADD